MLKLALLDILERIIEKDNIITIQSTVEGHIDLRVRRRYVDQHIRHIISWPELVASNDAEDYIGRALIELLIDIDKYVDFEAMKT